MKAFPAIMECCYLCNCAFIDNKAFEHMFEKRLNSKGLEQSTLSSILAMALGVKLEANNVHSVFICSTCKVNLLNFEAISRQLFQLRYEIIETHKQTSQLYAKTNIQIKDELIEECDVDDQENDDLDLEAIEQRLLEVEAMLDEQQEESFETLDAEHSMMSSGNTERLLTSELQTVKHGKPPPLPQFKCSFCGKVCERHEHLLEHERIHTGERPFVCAECGASFAQRSNWRVHMNDKHLKLAKYKCSDCGRCYKRKRLLDNHIKAVHTKQRDLKCQHCDATFSNAVNLKKHLLCHTGTKNYRCHICGKHFSRAENRNVHHFVHSIRKPYACGVCGEGFIRKQQLVQHSRINDHPNPRIVRLKPQFSAANSDKLLAAAASN